MDDAVLTRLDKVFPSGVMDRPIFGGLTEPTKATAPNADGAARALGAGEYDRLFAGAPDRPSDLYRAALIPPPALDVWIRSSEPFQPETFVLPGYPPIARLARIEGAVVVTFQVDANGGVTDTQFESGHPMLRPTVTNAVSGWKYPKKAADHRIKATIDGFQQLGNILLDLLRLSQVRHKCRTLLIFAPGMGKFVSEIHPQSKRRFGESNLACIEPGEL